MDRKQGGLGGLKYPLLSDFSKQISRDYDVLVENAGLALRGNSFKVFKALVVLTIGINRTEHFSQSKKFRNILETSLFYYNFFKVLKYRVIFIYVFCS